MSSDRDCALKYVSDAQAKRSESKSTTPSYAFINQQQEATELKPAFRKCWTTVDHIHIPLRTFHEKSFFVPNALMLFNILFDIEKILNDQQRSTTHIPPLLLSSRTTKKKSGKLEKIEGSWLGAFSDRFKDTSLPIAGSLVPYFANIVTVLLHDGQYDLVYPTIEKKGTYSVDQDDATRHLPAVKTSHYLVPSVPLVASLLRDFCTTTTLGNDKFDDNDDYIPFDLSTGGNFAGVTFPAKAGANQHIAHLLTNPVLMRPLPESKDKLLEIHSYWRKSRVREIPEIPMNLAYSPESPSGWTMIADNDDFDWFEKCADMATIQCKYFLESTTLSAIPTTGGNSALVVAKIKLDTQPEPPTSVDGWYNAKLLEEIKAQFVSHTTELEHDDVCEASYALTNAELSWMTNGCAVGSTDSGLRKGPYFTNNKVNYKLDYDVSVGRKIYSMIRVSFYDAAGKA